MKIREADRSDAAALTECIRSGFRDVAERFALNESNCPTHPSFCCETWIHNAMDDGVGYFCLEDDAAVIGCAALEKADEEVGYLERLAVMPGRRGEGLGIQLVNYVCDRAKSLGLSRISIAVIAEQTELCAWYERRGFHKTRWKQFDHLPFTVQFLEKVL